MPGSANRLTTTRVYDNLNRLTSISSAPSAASALSHAYTYNSANQRTHATREDLSHWDFSYDALGQVTAGTKKLSTGEIILGDDYAYTFDDIGNRKTATANGQTSLYNSSLVNQYLRRTVPGALDVFGTAKADATVTVTSPAGSDTIFPTTRQGERFNRQLTVDNSSMAQYPGITVTGVKNNVGPNGEDALTAQTRQSFVPKTPEAFGYDADGNLTQDGRWTYTWDADVARQRGDGPTGRLARRASRAGAHFVGGEARQNRLVSMETRADVVAQASSLPRPAPLSFWV